MSKSVAALVSLTIFFTGCARTAPLRVAIPALPSESTTPSPYANVPFGKNLRTSSEFIVVDDFNAPEKKNRLGHLWQVEGVKEERLRPEVVPPDSLVGKRGMALFLNASIPSGKIGLFKSPLDGLDVSQAKALVLKCQIQTKAGAPFSGKLRLTLRDLRDQSQSVDFTRPCLLASASGGNGWKEAVFDRSLFAALDWNRLSEIAIAVSAGEDTLKAKVGLDEIAFFGVGDLEFRSQRDNLIGFPTATHAPEKTQALLAETQDDKFLYEIARDTWKYFENALDRKTQLPVDHIRVTDPGQVGAYTSPTNLAMYFLACVSAHELGLISRADAVKRISRTSETLRQMKRWHGFHYNFYSTVSLEPTRAYVSTVDSGWLAASWMVVRQAFPKELGEEAGKFLDEINFEELYDPINRQLRLGYDHAANKFSPYHYGLIASEARVASFIAIGKGDLEREHWWRIYRVLPKDWDWQSQVPNGGEVEIEGVRVLEGYYVHQGVKFVPSWGGSLFEFLMPSLVMKEKELAPKSFGLNNRIATEIQIDYALNRQGYPIWGMSPTSVSSGRQWRYVEYGVKYLGVKGYRDEGIIAPYASFLALDSLPEHAIDNIRKMLEIYPVYGEYGFYDSVNVRNGQVNSQYLALDQGMILVAIANYLKGGVIKGHFHRDAVARKAESLLGVEEWFR